RSASARFRPMPDIDASSIDACLLVTWPVPWVWLFEVIGSIDRDRADSITFAGQVHVHPVGGELVMASISERENPEIEGASSSGKTPVVFIHGLWLLPGSWATWADLFRQAGYAPLTPDWPDDPETVEQARANPDVLAGKTLEQVAGHTTEIINALD